MRIRRVVSLPAALLLAIAFAVAACGSSASTGAPGASTGGGGGDKTPGAEIPNAGGGSCQVTIAGDVSASWSEQQNLGSTLVSYWFSAAQREAYEMSEDEQYFVINCKGDAGQLSLLSVGDTTAADIPMGPASYVVVPKFALGEDGKGKVSMLLTLDDETLWRAAENGTFNVTTLDAKRFAGNFEFKVESLGDDLETVVASATVSGTFDFACTGGACH
jgi:hypothetical protein